MLQHVLKFHSFSVVCIYHILFIHSSVNRQSDFLHLWVIVNYDTMKVGTQIPGQGPAFTSSGYYLQIFCPILWFAFSLS